MPFTTDTGDYLTIEFLSATDACASARAMLRQRYCVDVVHSEKLQDAYVSICVNCDDTVLIEAEDGFKIFGIFPRHLTYSSKSVKFDLSVETLYNVLGIPENVGGNKLEIRRASCEGRVDWNWY